MADYRINNLPYRVQNYLKDGGTIDQLVAAMKNKVDKVDGKGLSTKDYTTEEKTKLAGIAEGAEVNVQSDWNVMDSANDAYIKNKPQVYSKSEVDAALGAKADKVIAAIGGNFAALDEYGNLYDSIFCDTDFAYRVSGATSGHLAGLDENGNLTDSGKSASDLENVLEGVQIGGTDLTIDENKKVNIPIASASLGAVKTNANYGIVAEQSGLLEIYPASTTDIVLRAVEEDPHYQYRNYKPIVCGNLDYAVRSVRPSTATTNPTSSSRMAVNTIYTFGNIGSEATFYLPSSGQVGDFVEINFAIASTVPTITFDAPSGMWISDYDATLEANKSYTFFADYGAIAYGETVATLGWRISRAEYELPPSTT